LGVAVRVQQHQIRELLDQMVLLRSFHLLLAQVVVAVEHDLVPLGIYRVVEEMVAQVAALQWGIVEHREQQVQALVGKVMLVV
jgi:hypothetical protein